MEPLNPNQNAYTRRAFLSSSLVMASAAMTVPMFLQRSAFGLPRPADGMSSIPGVPEGNILVVVQLAGGNDGLNTVVPFGDPAYYRARPSIGIPEDAVLKLDGERAIGLHPRLAGVKELYDEGLASIVQGVGYPNPNRSHFKSMDIWHTADTSGTGTGWLGRYFDNNCAGTGDGGRPEPEPLAGIAIGREAPLAMQGSVSKPVGFESPDLFRWIAADDRPELRSVYEALNQGGGAPAEATTNADFLSRTALDAQISSEKIRRATSRGSLASYPGNRLAAQLQMVASMIRAELPTRVYYVTLGGFDTHAAQGGVNGTHANLLSQFSSSIRAFYEDLRAQGNDGRVLTMSFSEFGRRVRQSASAGTDHGTAAPVFLFGPMVNAGVLGRHPSLTDLDSGDLKFGTDFRSVYAGILESWLKADSKAVLERRYKPVEVVRG